jgi:hypothetical protein
VLPQELLMQVVPLLAHEVPLEQEVSQALPQPQARIEAVLTVWRS